MSLIVHQDSLDASRRLLQRMFPEDESKLQNLVFGTTEPPRLLTLQDPQHPLTKCLVSMLKIDTVAIATIYTVGELHLDPDQVDQLQVQDPRIVRLKQNILNQISNMPIIQDLRAERLRVKSHQRLTQINNATIPSNIPRGPKN